MSDYGDDAGHCSNGLSSRKFLDASPEERTVYRRWIRGAGAVYGILFLVAGVLAWIGSAHANAIELTSGSTNSPVRSADASWADAHF
ncbi:hypothetical protein JQ615_37450 [Bradyrhizobium jicamae]|uniref:Uncharacterized protein n=1 Tax=Bradyrhizobium jicamae TaxID=280332 RepID=A0ABS5FW95_9BRAD|nr:hypothetical protein [Bradyrhizobium jicamae]MBR0801062.1 hypothetical protein [Bradyrhizobium jicamae]